MFKPQETLEPKPQGFAGSGLWGVGLEKILHPKQIGLIGFKDSPRPHPQCLYVRDFYRIAGSNQGSDCCYWALFQRQPEAWGLIT